MARIHPSTWIISLRANIWWGCDIYDFCCYYLKDTAHYAIILRRQSRNWPNFSKLPTAIPATRFISYKSPQKLPKSISCDNVWVLIILPNILSIYWSAFLWSKAYTPLDDVIMKPSYYAFFMDGPATSLNNAVASSELSLVSPGGNKARWESHQETPSHL